MTELLERTFFPTTRKKVFVESLSLLKTRAGEHRIKLSVAMPLSDGKLVGLPSWIGDSLDVIGREDSLVTKEQWGHSLKEMTLTVYSADDSPRPAVIAVCPLLSGFSLRRDPQDEGDEEVSELNLHFMAYVNATTELWAWFYRNFRQSIYVGFATTQADLPLVQAEDKQMKLGESEDYESVRREATSKAHDAEFARA